MNKNRTIIFGVLGGVVLILIITLFGLFSGSQEEDPRLTLEGQLDVWGVFDEEVAYSRAIDDFNTIYPELQVEYRRFNSVESYERTLLNSLASGEGPDIFMIRNNDLARKISKITPLSRERYSDIDLKSQFPDIVSQNFVFNRQVYAIPLSIDTLTLIYNKDIFGESNVVFPPETWSDFKDTSSQITEYDQNGNIEKSGAAIGGAENVERSKDILSVLLLQQGAPMVNDQYTRADFTVRSNPHPLEFYASFAKRDSENFSWSRNSSKSSLEAFKSGNVGMILDYQSALREIEQEASYLNVDVAPLPQFARSNKKINYAHYWGYTVSKQSELRDAAWDFVLNTTTKESNARGYLATTEKPPALSSLVQETLNDTKLNVFSSQILTAKAWAEPDPDRVVGIFHDAIEGALDEESFASSIMREAQSRVTNLIKEL